jgi:hypothetical protein
VSVTPRAFFDALELRISEAARKCDVGLHVRACGGAFVNNYREGRSLTIGERLQWLAGKMTERRLGRWESVTLASLFPEDAAIVTTALASASARKGCKK